MDAAGFNHKIHKTHKKRQDDTWHRTNPSFYQLAVFTSPHDLMDFVFRVVRVFRG